MAQGSMAARLRSLAERLPERPEIAAELLTLAAGCSARSARAGMASAKAQAKATAPTRARALTLAQSLRKAEPDRRQVDVARAVADLIGGCAPSVEAVVLWVRAWERAGLLPPRKTTRPTASIC